MNEGCLKKQVEEVMATKMRMAPEALCRMVEYVVMNAFCNKHGECWLEARGQRLVCHGKSCWWSQA